MTRPYGRFYYLAKYLSESGHDVCMFLFSYKKNENETVVIDQLMMRSISIYPDYVFGINTVSPSITTFVIVIL